MIEHNRTPNFRRPIERELSVTKRSQILAGVIAVAVAVVLAPRLGRADGKQIFLDQKCNKCHSLKALGIEKVKVADPEDAEGGEGDGKEAKGPDLSDQGLKGHDAGWYSKWLNKEIKKKSVYDEAKEVSHKKKFKGTPEELKAVADFLLEQKKKVE